MSVASKVALGLGGAGAVGTGSYFAVSSLSKENSPQPKTKLSKKLVDGGFDLLSFKLGRTDNSTEWNAILTKYKDSGNKDLLEGVNISNVDTDDTNALKSACSSLMDLEDVSDEIYNKARRWCVVPKKVSEILGKLSKTILKNTSTDRSNDPLWTQNAERRRQRITTILLFLYLP
ncbi:hypothetical protein HF1_04330 [Mycoplasma haemofelis str. Langford 1]|uniref:Uncharacterized protein n=1 Tax=Mycoplasma haemofelis (strain Langford 1) TaxID=941640 RepID=E8ZH20_MYCHL|nr:hypothetical protein HF1_04330 [Mycoplasma haemofelis str. Langford 1]